tara:strand:+ start:15011 stop:15871 length:861 start_codon:yes stop_codon:yes gene_type:complete
MHFLKSSSELKNIIGECKDLVVLGNGPSLKVTPASFLNEKKIVGMNRIDKFIVENDLELFIYIFVTDNIENKSWGLHWLDSLEKCSKISKYTLLSSDVVEFLNKSSDPKSKEILSRNIIVLECLIEPPLYSNNAVSKSSESLSKSGTSINLASQVAISLGVRDLTYCGVDLGWKKTSKNKQNDPNHYHSNYFARIDSGYIENCRMHSVHDRLSVIYNNLDIKVKNFSPMSTVEVYDNYDFEGNIIYSGKYNHFSVLNRFLVMSYSEAKNSLKREIVRALRFLGFKK